MNEGSRAKPMTMWVISFQVIRLSLSFASAFSPNRNGCSWHCVVVPPLFLTTLLRGCSRLYSNYLWCRHSPRNWLGCSDICNCRFPLYDHGTLPLGSLGRLDVHNSWFRPALLARSSYLCPWMDLPQFSRLSRYRDAFPRHGPRRSSSMPTPRFRPFRRLLLFPPNIRANHWCRHKRCRLPKSNL